MKRILLLFLLFPLLPLYSKSWEARILPAEHKTEIDAASGAKIVFVTTHPGNDSNFYFHDLCRLFRNELMLFVSDRSKRQEVYGYLTRTGEIVGFNLPEDVPGGNPVASRKGDRFYVMKENGIFEWRLTVGYTPSTRVTVEERRIGTFPQGARPVSGMTENSDQSLLCFGYKIGEDSFIAVMDVETGGQEVITRVPFSFQHLQFHWHRPDILAMARSYGNDTAPLDPKEPAHARLWFVHLKTKVLLPAFYQQPGELVTHECWWVNDQITFIGGHKPEEAHLKVLDLKTGEIRIVGAGSWWEGADTKEVSRYNWWHGAGSPNGKWLAADNWHGIISIFNAKTTEKKILTTGHRTYGRGAHPHVGWDLLGESVEFTSNKLGNPDVCIGFLPKEWK